MFLDRKTILLSQFLLNKDTDLMQFKALFLSKNIQKFISVKISVDF